MLSDPVRFKRAALIVGDLDRSLALYEGALGFRLQSIKESASDSYSYEIFGIDHSASLRMAALDGPRGQERTLALIEVRPAPPRLHRPSAATVIEVRDLVDTLRRLSALPGLTILPERPLHTHDGRVGREIGVLDADGHALVLYHV